MTKPQDVVVCLWLSLGERNEWTYETLGQAVGLSASAAHASVKRCRAAGLIGEHSFRTLRSALAEFTVYGVPYAYPAQPGPPMRGVPTGFDAPPLHSIGGLRAASSVQVVWPYAAGTARASSVQPLYKSVPEMAIRAPEFYALAALVDALRVGRSRERSVAQDELVRRLGAASLRE
jgi:hypothetical protein